jgi:ABC-type phosphate transport system ATPase subunit
MNSITAKMLFTAVGFLLFISAAAVGAGLFIQNHIALDEVDAVLGSRDRDVVLVPVVEGEEKVSGAAVMQSVFQIEEVGTDIQVDGYLFSKDVDIKDTDVSIVDLRAIYSMAYQRDGDGVLERLIFRKQ